MGGPLGGAPPGATLRASSGGEGAPLRLQAQPGGAGRGEHRGAEVPDVAKFTALGQTKQVLHLFGPGCSHVTMGRRLGVVDG